MSRQDTVLCQRLPSSFSLTFSSVLTTFTIISLQDSRNAEFLRITQDASNCSNKELALLTELCFNAAHHTCAWTKRLCSAWVIAICVQTCLDMHRFAGLFGETCQTQASWIYSFIFSRSLFSNCLLKTKGSKQLHDHRVGGVYTPQVDRRAWHKQGDTPEDLLSDSPDRDPHWDWPRKEHRSQGRWLVCCSWLLDDRGNESLPVLQLLDSVSTLLAQGDIWSFHSEESIK